MPANPWKQAEREPKQQATSSQGFPPLNTQGLSKAQRRARAVYTQSTTFEPYPPRLEQLNRQELNRRLLEEDTYGTVERKQPTLPQESGISSVTIYNAEGERLSRGPDIYRRAHAIKSSHEKGKARQPPQARREEEEIMPLPLPTPFTDKKLDILMQECGRLERVHAIEDRTKAEGTGQSNRESAYEPLKQELIKAFTSLDGFLAAFGKEQIQHDS